MRNIIIAVTIMAIMLLPSVVAEQEIMTIVSNTGTIDETSIVLKTVMVNSRYEIDNNENTIMIVTMHNGNECDSFEAKAKMNNDGTICFVHFTGVTYFLKDCL